MDDPDLAAAIAPVGCGCQMREDSAEDDDPIEAETFEQLAPDACERWQCPAADERAWKLARLGVPPPADADHLDDECREVLVAVERLTGARGLTTCPLFYTRLPSVHHAAAARRWAERGELRAKVGAPSAVLVHAVDLIDEGTARQMRREAKRRAAELDDLKTRGGPPGGRPPSDPPE